MFAVYHRCFDKSYKVKRVAYVYWGLMKLLTRFDENYHPRKNVNEV